MSRVTAANCARLAIAGLSLFDHPENKGRQSLAYEWPYPLQKRFFVVVPGKDVYPGAEHNPPQITGVQGTIDKFLGPEQPYLGWPGEAIDIAMFDASPPSASRMLRMHWLNAMYWYYMAGLEPVDARAVICYSSCLESLADGVGKDKILELLDQLLGSKPDREILHSIGLTLAEGINQIYSEARSTVVHGSKFVLNEDFDQARYLATHIAREALDKFQRRLVGYEAKHDGAAAADRKDAFLRFVAIRGDADRKSS